MTEFITRSENRWRIALWAGLAALLLLPLVAMQFTTDVVWTAGDFLFAGLMLAGLGLAFEFISRTTGNRTAQIAMGAAALAVFLLVWAQAAVGIF